MNKCLIFSDTEDIKLDINTLIANGWLNEVMSVEIEPLDKATAFYTGLGGISDTKLLTSLQGYHSGLMLLLMKYSIAQNHLPILHLL